MKEEAIFRPSVRDSQYRGRRKRSIPPYIRIGEKIQK
jgi:hypothetical protein